MRTWRWCSRWGWPRTSGTVCLSWWTLAPRSRSTRRSSPAAFPRLLPSPAWRSSAPAEFWTPADGKIQTLITGQPGFKNWRLFQLNLRQIPTTASPFFIPKHVRTPSWSAIATWDTQSQIKTCAKDLLTIFSGQWGVSSCKKPLHCLSPLIYSDFTFNSSHLSVFNTDKHSNSYSSF